MNQQELTLNKFYEWKTQIQNETILFHIINYSSNFLYLWISNNSRIDNLACATNTPYQTTPLGTEIINVAYVDNNLEQTQYACELAKKLAKRLNKQVFVSYNVAHTDLNFHLNPLIEKHLIEKIKINPNLF
jgi:hypothetical protein